VDRQLRKQNVVRIIGGELRSRRLVFPASEGLRPTADRIRETLFNWLRDEVEGARCLDLFAGSGALGIEAASRGAAWVDLVEKDGAVCRALRGNLLTLGVDRAGLHRCAALDFLRRGDAEHGPYHIVFLDPPYGDDCLGTVCRELQASGMLAPRASIYLEHSARLDPLALPAAWRERRQKKAGRVNYYLFVSGAHAGQDARTD